MNQMSTKKANTPSKRKANNQTTREQLRRKLAQDIASVLNNPECPVTLWNAIGEEVCDWSSYYCNAVNRTPDYIEKCLTYYQQEEARRTKGGAR
jgi:hypothetical protein